VIHQAMEAIGDFPEYGPDTTYGGPVLFVSGSESDYIQPEHRPAIGALFPQAKARVVNGAGHWVHSEQPEGFLRAIDRFLQA
ncbi:MAG: alpha/beta hydrolase, partial [Rhodospirillaceae bacterium]